MPGESIEGKISKIRPRTEERDVWKEFHKYVNLGDTDKIFELAVFLFDQGREKDAEKVLGRGRDIYGDNFSEKAKELLEGFNEEKDNDE